MSAEASAASSLSVSELRLRVEELEARLRSEREEAQHREAAISELLQSINASAGNLAPVFDALLEKAMRLCGAAFGILRLWDGSHFHAAASRGVPAAYAEFLAHTPQQPRPGSIGSRLVSGEPLVHVLDVASEAIDSSRDLHRRALVDLGGARTSLVVALTRDQRMLGAIQLYRRHVQAFSDKQIALLQNFAAQAVIAMENARLLAEQREALEQQTATSEILRAISQSPTDVQPVLKAVVGAARRFCGADDAIVVLREETEQLMATHEGSLQSHVGTRIPLDRSSATGRATIDGQTFHIPDVASLNPVEHAMTIELTRRTGVRALLAAPMLREGQAIGSVLLRRPTPGAFTLRQIELLEAFAAQAVIAIENVRLFTELRESLEQQTATAEVLQVISQSPTDVAPVLQAVGAAARRFCGAEDASIFLRDGGEIVAATHSGHISALAIGDRDPLDLSTSRGQSIIEGRTVHIPDVEALDPDRYTLTRVYARQYNFRATVSAPMLRDGRAIGCIALRKPGHGPFTARQIALLESFAAQAVIAIENVRLFTELKESLEQQTASSEILQVISQSPTDVTPVLNAVAKAAVRFCGAEDVTISLQDGAELTLAAHEGPISSEEVGRRYPLDGATIRGRAIIDGRTIHVPDAAGPEGAQYERTQELAKRLGFHAVLAAPMLREEEAIGSIALRKSQPGAFTPRQIELLETFAAQAVIAIENVRLFTELKESLEQQTATAEILRAISQSPTDVQPVLDAVGKAALRFCGAIDVMVQLRDGDGLLPVVHVGPLKAPVGIRRSLDRSSAGGRAVVDARTIHIPNMSALDPVEYGTVVKLARENGTQALVGAPMLRDGAAMGSIVLRKSEVGAFTPKQIELLETFAAQAVIAIENVRLFRELEERNADLTEALEQQTATSEVLKAISHSAFDLGPVFEAVVENAVKLCEAERAFLFRFDGRLLRAAASYNASPALREWVDNNPIAPGRQSISARAAFEQRTVHVPDVQADSDYDYALRDSDPIRTILAVPMLKGGSLIGTITIYKLEVSPFTDKQIALLETFAAQAVIAIENVRLLTELRDSLEQQTATAEVLRAISQSPTDVQPVLEAVSAAARRFCGALDASITLREGEQIALSAHAGEGIGSEPIGTRVALDRGTMRGRSILDAATVHFGDVLAADAGEYGPAQQLARKLGFRAIVSTPMLRDGRAIGCVTLRKIEPVAFTPRQIELLETFAAQAVIAIENVRLFTELRDSLERLKAAQANLIQAEKMASLGQLTAGIAHEIKNPLNFVNNFAGLSVELLDELKQAAAPVLAGMDDDARAEFGETVDLITANLEKIAEHGKRADGIVKSMLAHSRGGTGDWQGTNINALVEEALNLAYHGARAQDKDFNVTLERDFAETTPIEVVPQDVTRVFLNLFGNGFYAAKKRQMSGTGSGYRPTLTVSTRDLGDAVEVRVRDNGTGIPPEVRAKLFQPFFTTKPTGEGTGLGLSISYDIVTQQHGGSIEVESEPGSFTEFTVRLPRRRRVA